MVLTTSALHLPAYPLQTPTARAEWLNLIRATSDNELRCVIDIFAGKHHHHNDASPIVFTLNEKCLSGNIYLVYNLPHTHTQTVLKS
jgi:hypothetical protein